MIEWVQNTHGLRQILNKLYRERGLYLSGEELKTYRVPVSAPLK